MKGIAFTFTWAFILLAAAYDGYFAWQNRADFEIWELNPLACWVVRNFRIEVLGGLKAIGILFATGVATYCLRRRNRLAMPMTMIIGCSYFLLTMHYVAGSMSSPDSLDAAEPAWASRLVP